MYNKDVFYYNFYYKYNQIIPEIILCDMHSIRSENTSCVQTLGYKQVITLEQWAIYRY